MNGCFALEDWTGAAERQDAADFPVLHMTRLHTRKPCMDLLSHVRSLDRECWRLKREAAAERQRYEAELEAWQRDVAGRGAQYEASRPQEPPPPPDCPDDDAIALIGSKVCDAYEGTPGAWKDTFLAECDCLKRDHVPRLEDVVAACRVKAQEEQLAQQAYEQALAAAGGASTSGYAASLVPPERTLDDATCDRLQRNEGVLLPEYRKQRDAFHHLLARYLVRRPWAEILSKHEEALHPHCTYEPCRDPVNGMMHVSYPDTEAAKGSCTNVARCEAQINYQYTGGTVRVYDNLFRVKCDGGTNCTGATSLQQKCRNGGVCQPDGSCVCPKGWTGDRCEIRAQAKPVVRDPEETATTTTTTTPEPPQTSVPSQPTTPPTTAAAEGEVVDTAALLIFIVPLAILVLGALAVAVARREGSA
jgi:hypothetical protein